MKGDIEELRTIIRLLTFLTVFLLAFLILRAEYEEHRDFRLRLLLVVHLFLLAMAALTFGPGGILDTVFGNVALHFMVYAIVIIFTDAAIWAMFTIAMKIADAVAPPPHTKGKLCERV